MLQFLFDITYWKHGDYNLDAGQQKKLHKIGVWSLPVTVFKSGIQLKTKYSFPKLKK